MAQKKARERSTGGEAALTPSGKNSSRLKPKFRLMLRREDRSWTTARRWGFR